MLAPLLRVVMNIKDWGRRKEAGAEPLPLTPQGLQHVDKEKGRLGSWGGGGDIMHSPQQPHITKSQSSLLTLSQDPGWIIL